MLTEHGCPAVALVAYLACKWLIDSMHGHVFGQMAVNIKDPTANITFEYLVAGVNFFMCIQSTLTAEFFTTNIALKWFFAWKNYNEIVN